MSGQFVARYGSWRSPITSDFIVSETVGLSDVILDGQQTYWVESRPSEGGRAVIVRCHADGTIADVTPRPFNARTRVHEYGGGAYAVSGGTILFSNFEDQKIYRIDSGSQPRAITQTNLRYADGIIDPRHARLVCVQEDHRDPKVEAVNSIVGVDLAGDRGVRELISGNNFYSNPRVSPDGNHMAWLTWNHPYMPWVATELWVGDVAPDGSIVSPVLVAGGQNESVFQPEWSRSGVLYFVSDRTKWWNIYRLGQNGVEPLISLEAEFGVAQWYFGLSCFSFVSDQQIACAYTMKGDWKLALLDLQDKSLMPIDLPGTDFGYVRASKGRVVVRAGSPTEPLAIVDLDLTTGRRRVLRQSANPPGPDLQPYISVPVAVDFPTDGGLSAHAFVYRPRNPEFVAPRNSFPPLITKSHGGPTAAAAGTLDFRIQYWTSRGFAVIDVNYGGSTGYGRDYRERLKTKWGIVDVADCINGAKSLVCNGEADQNQLIITGGSAGGYTTLCALTFHKEFNAGASYYGISDLEALARDTHKFESHYMEWLVAPYPQGAKTYRERSPIHFASRLSVPVIFFQGEDDKVVPPNQTELMVEALRAQQIPFGYFLFAGEQHGFRRADNIKRSLDGELYFYAVAVTRSGLRF